MRRVSILNFKNFINGHGIEAGIIVINRIFQLPINGFRNIQDKLGKLLVTGEADGNPGIQLVKEAKGRSDHVLVILGAVQNPVHENPLVLVLAGQNLEGHGQHGAVVGLGSLDLQGFHPHFILASGNSGKIPAAVLLGFLHIGLKALQINRTINLIKINSHSFFTSKMYFLETLQKIEQAGKGFSGFFCFLHFGPFLVSRGEPFNRLEQFISKDGVKQVIGGRFCHQFTEIIMFLCIHDHRFLCGQLMKGDHGFRVNTGRGGDQVGGNGDLAEKAPLLHFLFELLQGIAHGLYLLNLIGNDLSYFPHGMGDFLTINPLPLKNLGNCGGFRLNILKGSAVAL
uniref:Uncharacterized protein n=1 Tax=Siphoviridae sp. ct3es5 TaxID=2825322 RepID=A0A8S5PTD5_9CAUD|nr:MAG TPA: hypothetical protein [Siphoviridae sp. ct3es5]